MPTTYSATILLESSAGSEALITMSYAPTMQAVLDFAAALLPLTTASIIKCTFTASTDPQLFGSGGEVADTSFAAHFKFTRTDPTADVRTQQFRLPAPKLSIFEHIPGRGYRVIPAFGDTLATAFSALRGETFEFDSGWMVS